MHLLHRHAATAALCAGLALPASVWAGPGDPSATFIAGNANPGETTSTACKANGFLEVIFRAGGTIVSSVESGTPCTPTAAPASGSKGLGGDPDAAARTRVNDALRSLQIADDLQAALDKAVREGHEYAPGEFPPELQEVLEREAQQATEDQKSALRAQLQAELADARAAEQDAKAALAEALAEIGPARAALAEAEDAQAAARAEADLFDAEVARWERIRALAARYRQALSDGASDLADRLRSELVAAGMPQTRSATAYSEAKLGVARTRRQEFQPRLDAAADEVARHADDVTRIEGDIRAYEAIAERNRGYQAEIERELRILEAEFQFAGSPATTLEALRARGIDVWASGDFTSAEDRQAGRRQDVDLYRGSVGAHVRVSERLVAGLAAGYSFTDSDDATGTGISSETDTYFLSPYLAYRISETLAADAALSYAFSDVESVRAGTATSDHAIHSGGIAAGISASRQFSPWVTASGRIGQSYFYSDAESYTDSTGLVVPSRESETAYTSVSAGLDVEPGGGWTVFGDVSARYNLISPEADVDRADSRISGGAAYDLGGVAVRGTVGTMLFRNDYSDIQFGLRLDTQL